MTAALNMGLPAPINIQVRGGKLEVLQMMARRIKSEIIAKVQGTVDVRVGEPEDHPAVEIMVDRTKAKVLGLDQEDVIKNVATAVNSSCNFLSSYWISPISREISWMLSIESDTNASNSAPVRASGASPLFAMTSFHSGES